MQDKIVTEVNNGTLEIYHNEKMNWNWNRGKNVKMQVYVSAPTINSLKANGSSDVYGKNTIQADDFSLEAHGSSDVNLSLEVSTLECKLHGSSDAKLAGSAKSLNLEAHGSSDFKASGLSVRDAQIKQHGSSDAYIKVDGTLAAELSGSSDLHYKGSPKINKLITSGSADAIRQ